MADRTLTTNTQKQAASIVQIATGKWVADAGSAAVAMTFQLGFSPRFIRFVNATDRIIDEWFDGMAADSAVETAAAGTNTLETSGGITVNAPGSGAAVALVDDPGLHSADAHSNAQGGLAGNSFTVHSDLVPASKTGYWLAIG